MPFSTQELVSVHNPYNYLMLRLYSVLLSCGTAISALAAHHSLEPNDYRTGVECPLIEADIHWFNETVAVYILCRWQIKCLNLIRILFS